MDSPPATSSPAAGPVTFSQVFGQQCQLMEAGKRGTGRGIPHPLCNVLAVPLLLRFPSSSLKSGVKVGVAAFAFAQPPLKALRSFVPNHLPARSMINWWDGSVGLGEHGLEQAALSLLVEVSFGCEQNMCGAFCISKQGHSKRRLICCFGGQLLQHVDICFGIQLCEGQSGFFHGCLCFCSTWELCSFSQVFSYVSNSLHMDLAISYLRLLAVK